MTQKSSVQNGSMSKSSEFLSNLVVYNKYANYLPDSKRRQTWEECVYELESMHIRKFPDLKQEIMDAFSYVYKRKVMPSMRSIQFGGLPIELNPARIYNCSYAAIDHPFVFAETLFLLLSGCGVGYSVRKRHIKKLPAIVTPQGDRRFLIGDSIEGWADSVRQLVYAYMKGKERPRFDYRDIRPKGSLIKKSGGRAPGPEKLKLTHIKIESVLKQAIGRKLNELEVQDIICYIADCVISGGVREAALISLFDVDSQDMLTCKGNFKIDHAELIEEYKEGDDFGWKIKYVLSEKQKMNTNVYGQETIAKISGKYGDWDYKNAIENGILPWFYVHPQRARANNSVAIRRGTIKKPQFMNMFNTTKDSMAGEPGFWWTNDDDMGANPCNEISLNSNQFCNLTSVVVYDVTTQEELNKRVKAAAFIGTLQASYVDFHYLRAVWKETTEREALLGVSMTGIASGTVLKLDLEEAAATVVAENERVASIIGTNPAARTTCVKPEGNGTLAMGVIGSGIHAAHAQYFLRSVRIKKADALYPFLMEIMPDFVESELADPENKAVVSVPMKAPNGVITRDESAIDLLERIKKFSTEWVNNGHNNGVNSHNVSATVSIKDTEWDEVADWMWENKKFYNGLSLLPYSGHTYRQAPFIDISEEEYNSLMAKFPTNVDFTQIVEENGQVNINHVGDSLACSSGGGCEIK